MSTTTAPASAAIGAYVFEIPPPALKRAISIPSKDFSLDQINGSKKLYSILSEVGGRELVGKAKELSPGTFWVE